MTDLNRVTIIARLTRDAELKYTQSGTAICNFSVANNRTWSTNGDKKEEVNYFDCIAWGKQGEFIAEYAKKGKRVAIDGRLQQNRWEDKDGSKRSKIEIIVESIQILDYDKKDSQETSAPESNNPFADDNIPF